MVYCNEACDRYANALWMFWLFIQFPMLISINIYITGRLSLSHASLTLYLPLYRNLHMCSRLIWTTFRIFNERTNNDSIQCQLKLKIGTHMHALLYIVYYKMNRVENGIGETIFWTHFENKKPKFIPVSSSVMWSYNRNGLNELQIKKNTNQSWHMVLWKKLVLYLRNEKRSINESKIETDFMNGKKTVRFYWHMCA